MSALRLLLVAAVLAPAALGEAYQWPLDLPPQLTSSFAEYRPGRFHAGIDLRTGGVGLPVHAAADGYVSRVRCSPYGYGKAVYLTLADGNTAIYAHLDGYDEVLTAYVRKAQHAKESYEVDLYPKAGEFPVKRGQVLAQSGQTGIGAPHLHYEIRDAQQRPIHPNEVGVTWPDTARPTLTKIVIEPLAPDASVAGDALPLVRALQHDGNGRYNAGKVNARGALGFGVDVVDRSGPYRLGVHELRLLVDGEERFVMRHDRLSYDNHRNAAVAYHPGLARQGRFLLLRRWPGNVCGSYAYAGGDGTVVLNEGDHRIEVIARDAVGNESTAVLDVDTAPPAVVAAVSGSSLFWGPLGLGVTLPGVTGDEPLLEGSTDVFGVPVTHVLRDGRRAFAAPATGGMYTLHAGGQSYPCFFLHRGEPAQAAAFGPVDLRAQPGSAYGLLIARAYPLDEAPTSPIPRRGAAYRLWPDDMPVDEPVDVGLPLTDDAGEPGRCAVYRHNGKSWQRQGSRREGGKLRFTTRQFGTFAVLEDDASPTLANVLPRNGYQAQTRRPHVKATIDDVGSGVDTIRVTCDGRWLLVAYDPERKQIAWERDEDLTPGSREIRFQIRDLAGNVTEISRTVIIPG